MNAELARFSLGVTKMDKIRNEYIRGQLILDVLEKVKEVRLRWFRHVQRRDSEYII